MNGVVVVGSYNQDHVWIGDELPQPGATRSGRYLSGPGGKGFNQAVACARSHAATTFLVALGNDAAAQHARALATGFGIDLVDEVHADVATGSAGIFVDARGRNVIVVALGANAVLSTGFVDAEMARLRAAAVTLAQLEVDRDAVFRALAIAREAGRRTILNPAPADAPVDEALLELADLITPNETEFAALCLRILGEQVVADAVAAMPSVELHALCRRLHKGSVVITLGSAGCFVSHADAATFNDTAASYRIAAIKANAIDTTGAGDAFNGALAAELARDPTLPLAAAIRYASAFAGVSTERRGAALSMPSRDDIVSRAST
jgi:ribokinase